MFHKIKQWFALSRAKKEEEKEIPSKRELLVEQKEFLEESKELKSMINKKKNI